MTGGLRTLATVLAMWPAAAAAQSGVIVDPENSASPSGGVIVGPENTGSAPSGVIVDPENAGSPPSGAIVDPENAGSAPSGAIVDPENAAPVAAPQAAPPPPAPEAAPSSTATRFRGTARSALAVDTAYDRSGEDMFAGSTQLELEVRHRFSSRWSATVEGTMRWEVAAAAPQDAEVFVLRDAAWRGSLEVLPGDLLLAGRWGEWLLRAGNQVVSWGTSDFTSPVDVINPRDFRGGLVATDGSNTIAIPAVDLTWVHAPVAWQLVLVPFFVPHRVDVWGTDNAIGRSGSQLAQLVPVDVIASLVDPTVRELIQPALLQTRLPDELPGNASLGSRIVLTGFGADLGLGYFWGWDRQPHLDVNPTLVALLEAYGALPDGLILAPQSPADLPPLPELPLEALESLQAALSGEELLAAEYRRRHHVTLDFVRYFGPIGVRTELLWSPEQSFYTAEATTVRRAAISGAFGLGWESGTGEVVVGTEVFHSRAFTTDGDSAFLLGSDNVLGLAGGVDWDLGSVADEASWWSRVGVRLGGVVFPREGDAAILPELRLEATEATTVSLTGLLVVDGGGEGPVDLLDGNDQVGVRVTTAF